MRRIALAGFLWSLATMTKVVTLYLPLILAWHWRKEPKKLCVWFLSAYLLPLLWCAHNKAVIRQFVFTTQTDMQVQGFIAGGVASIGHATDFNQTHFRSNAEAVQFMARHPIWCAKYVAYANLKLWGLTEFETVVDYFGVDRHSIPLNQSGRMSGNGTRLALQRWPSLWVALLLMTAQLAVFYFLFGFGYRWHYLTMVPVLWFWALSMAVGGLARYRLPIFPMMAMAMGSGIKPPPKRNHPPGEFLNLG